MRIKPAPETLAAYLEKHGLTREGFAELFAATFGPENAVSKTSVIWWINKRQRPEIHRRKQIEILTGGAVTVDSWETADERRSLVKGRARLASVVPAPPKTAA